MKSLFSRTFLIVALCAASFLAYATPPPGPADTPYAVNVTDSDAGFLIHTNDASKPILTAAENPARVAPANDNSLMPDECCPPGCRYSCNDDPPVHVTFDYVGGLLAGRSPGIYGTLSLERNYT